MDSMKPLIVSLLLAMLTHQAIAGDPVDVWPDMAPGETTRNIGETLPFRQGETPPVTRVTNITRPTFTVHPPEKPNGAAVLILPGGAYARVVTSKEGTDIATWLNEQGVTAFVLSYRTSDKGTAGWRKPLQDAQRAMSLIRSEADRWKIAGDRIGIMGFSAGGNAAARLLCDGGKPAYDRIDAVDDVPHRPDFAMLIYPWALYDPKRDALIEAVTIPRNCPPTFFVHTDDDGATSLSSVLFYAGLKKLSIPAELHIYGKGGHGYGMREIKDSNIATWPRFAAHWLESRGLLRETSSR